MRYWQDKCGRTWVDRGLGAAVVGTANAVRLANEATEIVQRPRAAVPESRETPSTVANQNSGGDYCKSQGNEFNASLCPNGCVRTNWQEGRGTRGKYSGQRYGFESKDCCISTVNAYGRNTETCEPLYSESVFYAQAPDGTWVPGTAD